MQWTLPSTALSIIIDNNPSARNLKPLQLKKGRKGSKHILSPTAVTELESQTLRVLDN
jgi:hypothetical protein